MADRVVTIKGNLYKIVKEEDACKGCVFHINSSCEDPRLEDDNSFDDDCIYDNIIYKKLD